MREDLAMRAKEDLAMRGANYNESHIVCTAMFRWLCNRFRPPLTLSKAVCGVVPCCCIVQVQAGIDIAKAWWMSSLFVA